jgi:hypothetical protein
MLQTPLFFLADANQSGAKSPVINYGPALCESRGKRWPTEELNLFALERKREFFFTAKSMWWPVEKSVAKWDAAPDKMQCT